MDEPAAAETAVLFPSMGEYPAYDDGVYDGFDADDGRRRAYRLALLAAAPGRVVVDIGTGRDALWAIEAARAGARRVYAIEADAGVAAQAEQAVARAGGSGRVSVIAGNSTRVRLPERAEVCVSEIVGNIASAEGAIAVLADARERLCAPGCVWIPLRMQTWAMAVDLGALLGVGGYAVATESLPYLRSVFASVGHPFDLRLCVAGPVHQAGRSSAAVVESLVFDSRREAPVPDSSTSVDLRVAEPGGRVTGLVLWTRIAASSHNPEVDALSGTTRAWAPVYVPISLPGLPVRAGDPVRVHFTRRTSDDGVHPDYRVAVELPGGTGTWSSPHHGRVFRGSAFYRRLFPGGDGNSDAGSGGPS